jgi:hypothetical protein
VGFIPFFVGFIPLLVGFIPLLVGFIPLLVGFIPLSIFVGFIPPFVSVGRRRYFPVLSLVNHRFFFFRRIYLTHRPS